jgi:hypothetical protein
MEKFIYTNSVGDSLTISYVNDDYIIKDYDGLTASEIIPITTSGYMQMGNTFIGNKLGARLINISFYVVGRGIADLYEKRRYLGKVFNPTLGEGILTYTNDYTTKSISVAVSSCPYPTEKNGSLQLFYIELVANNPLWYDTSINALKLGDFIGGLTFPLVFNTDIRFAQKGEIANITIDGDVPSPIQVEFRDNSLKPKLTLLNTSEFIKVDMEIGAGEKIVINTAYGNKTAIHTDANGIQTSAYNLITPDSTFFSLPVGDNQLTFAGDAGSPEVYIYWRNWYTGV